MGDGCSHGAGRGEPLWTGAGIGVPTVDDNGPSLVSSQMKAIELHRRRHDTILGKHASNRAGHIGDDQGQVWNLGLFDAAMKTGCSKTFWSGDAL